MGASTLGKRILRVWFAVGAVALVGMLLWFAVAYRASDEARAAMQSDSRVKVEIADNGAMIFTRAAEKGTVPLGLLFFPGSLVDPVAYAPLARAVAEAGFPVSIMPLPRRGIQMGSRVSKTFEETMSMLQVDVRARVWVVSGHSFGAALAARLVSQVVSMGGSSIVGLVLIGTTHPRDINLSSMKFPVTKIVGTNDGVASYTAAEQNRRMLPASTQWVPIEGGNHSQFGWYGFQPGDRLAKISAEAQHDQTIRAVVRAMHYTMEFYRPRVAADSSAGKTE